MTFEEAVPKRLRDAIVQINAYIEYMGGHQEELDRAKYHFDCQVGQHFNVLDRHHNFYLLELLTQAGADYFLKAADRMAEHFEPNPDELAPYQIPEVVLSHYAATTHENLLARRIGREVLWPLFHLMYGHPPNRFASIQLARYSAPSNLGTGWHSDTESEASCVVSLAPERHAGGGTLLMPHGVFGNPYHLPALPKGHALLFNGRTTLHRGLEVGDGERNLLVYWMGNV